MLRLLPLCVLLVAAPCAWPAWHADRAAIMGTEVRVELWHTDAEAAREAIAAVMTEMRRIDAAMSPFRESSELSRMNREASAHPIEISRELFALLEKSIEVSELTGGAFDVTFASAGRYYDYREGVRPDAATLAAAVEAIDYRFLDLDAAAGTVFYRHEGVHVDLGGIAKGYAVDRGIALLTARGIEQAMVSAGGDSRIIGDRRGRPWTVGVKDPRQEDAVAVLLPLSNTAISTSGDYERFFERDGVRYHHIIDPDTGDSARSVRSVTILGPNATFTDALSTSVFVMGVVPGLALINTLPGIDAIVIDSHGRLHYSEGIAPLGD